MMIEPVGPVPGTTMSATELSMYRELVSEYPDAHGYSMRSLKIVGAHIESIWDVLVTVDDLGHPQSVLRVKYVSRDFTA